MCIYIGTLSQEIHNTLLFKIFKVSFSRPFPSFVKTTEIPFGHITTVRIDEYKTNQFQPTFYGIFVTVCHYNLYIVHV